MTIPTGTSVNLQHQMSRSRWEDERLREQRLNEMREQLARVAASHRYEANGDLEITSTIKVEDSPGEWDSIIVNLRLPVRKAKGRNVQSH